MYLHFDLSKECLYFSHLQLLVSLSASLTTQLPVLSPQVSACFISVIYRTMKYSVTNILGEHKKDPRAQKQSLCGLLTNVKEKLWSSRSNG